MKKRVRINKVRMSLSIIVVLLIAAAALLFWPLPAEEVALSPEPVEIPLTIRCVGDIMGHLSQLMANYDKATDTYDFSGDYAYVKEFLGEANLALGNIETTFLGDGDYKGYPYFNSPDQLAVDVAATGIDVALVSNNHMLDTKLKGLNRSMDVLRDAGLLVAGAHKEGEERTVITNVDGVDIGIAAYTYETGLSNGRRTLNGSLMQDGAADRINSFRYYALDEDKATIAADISDLKERGADIVIAYFHWGEEYQRKPGNTQIQLAQFAAESGADIIFASHPHVLQGIDELEFQVKYPEPEPVPEVPEPWIIKLRKAVGLIKDEPVVEETTPEYWTKVVPVFYSMGNFISNQRQETLDNRYTEQGMIASVSLTYVPDTGEIKNVDTRCIPTWVEKYNKNGGTEYAIIPLVGDWRDNAELKASGHLSRAEQALDDVVDLVGGEYIYQYEYGAE